MICFKAGELTPCLIEVDTGKELQTEVIEIKTKDILSRFNKDTGWYVNWSEFESEASIYALVLKGTMDIQGLIALRPNLAKDFMAVHILWACTAPHNNVWEHGKQKYKGVGGHLFAIAADISEKVGCGGYLYGEAMDEEVLQYYMEHFKAERLPKVIHPYAMMIRGENTKRFREVYNYEWADRTI